MHSLTLFDYPAKMFFGKRSGKHHVQIGKFFASLSATFEFILREAM